MTRPVCLSLLLMAALAAGQGAVAHVDKALDPLTAPSERTALLQEIARTAPGRAELAKRGLDPKADPEVVHAVVEVLLSSDDPGEHIEPVCRLLLSEPHRKRVQQRIQRVAEGADDASKLVAKLEHLARGKTEESAREASLRVAAIRALGSIPDRSAVDIIVLVWNKDPDPTVGNECRISLDGVVDAPTPSSAEAYLRERPYATYYDLEKEVSRARKKQLDATLRALEQLLKTADPKAAFDMLGHEQATIREAASARIRELAEKPRQDGLIGGVAADAFAKMVFERFTVELGRAESVATIAHLCETLATLAPGGANSPLLKSVPADDLTRAVQGLSERKAEWQKVGEAAVRLLGNLGDPAKGVLTRFARGFGNSEVRRKAVFTLGQIARNSEKSQPYIGRNLAELLGSEETPEVRQQILISLRDAPVEGAVEPIRAVLFPDDPNEKTALTGSEPQYCVEILARIETPAALEVLLRLTAEADPEVRKLAAVQGLIPRTNGSPDHAKILAHLKGMILDPDQPAEVRDAVVAGLGETGRRTVKGVLRDLARAEGLDEALRARAVGARLRLAERLGVAGAEAEDLEAANEILREEWTPENRERIEPIAQAIIRVGDAEKKPVGDARALAALLAQQRDPEDKAALLALFREARAKAPQDRPSPGVEQKLLLAYRELVKETTEPARFQNYIDCSKRLAELAGQDRQAMWGYWLDAIQCAVDDMKDRALAEQLYKDMPKNGGLEGAASKRWSAIQVRLLALPLPQ